MVVESLIRISSADYYSCVLTKRIPVRVSLVAINGDVGFGILESIMNDEQHLIDYVDSLRESSSIQDVEITYSSDNEYWTRVVHKMSGHSIHDTILESGSMSIMPIIIESGYQLHRVLSPSKSELRDLLHLLRERFTHIELRRVHSAPAGLSRVNLTEKQKEAFVLAFEKGYYEIPRATTVEELSFKLGIKRVAMQERLRRAELKIMKVYSEGIV